MISKQLKNAYYVEIINTATNLLNEYSKIESNTMENPPSHVFPNLKKEISSLNRIYNNALIILLKSGMKFSTGSDKWNGCGKAIICVNGKSHEITMQNVKTILGGGYEKILDECFSAEPYDNIVESSINEAEIKKSYSKLFDSITTSLTNNSEGKVNEIKPSTKDKEIKGTVEKKSKSIQQSQNQKERFNVNPPQVAGVNEKKTKPHDLNKECKPGGVIEKNSNKEKTFESKKTTNKKNEKTKKIVETNKESKEIKAAPASMNKANKSNGNIPAKKVEEKPKVVKPKTPLFDDIDEFFDEIGEDINITVRAKEPAKKVEEKPHLIKKPVLAMNHAKQEKNESAETETVIMKEIADIEDRPQVHKGSLNDAFDDILQIDDEPEVHPIVQKEDVDILVGPKDLLMDAYKIKKIDPETNESKEFTILVAPLNNPEKDEFKSPIFAFGRTGRVSSTACSTTSDKPLIQLIIDGEAFIIRGSWSNGDFVSLVYPQNVDNQNISVTNIKQMRPEEHSFIGHNIFHVHNLKFHILPLASSNNKYDYASFIMCVENIDNNRYEMAEFMRGNSVIYKNNEDEYKIFTKWENEKLTHKLL